MAVTTIRATCPECGDIQTNTGNVVVRVMKDNEDEFPQYRFRCPKCSKIVLKETTPEIVDVLVTSGCKKEVWSYSDEVWERPPSGPVISLDDVIDLHYELEDENWIDKLLGGSSGEV